MFNDRLVLASLKELVNYFEAAEDPNGTFPCFDSSDLSRLGVGHILMWLLDSKNWAEDPKIEGFDSDPRTATGTNPLSPCAAEYFRLYNDDGKRDLLVVYSRSISNRKGFNEHLATYIMEFNQEKQKWEITEARVGL